MADLDFDSLYAEVVKPTAKKPTEAKPAEVKTEVKADVITRAAARPVQRTTGATTPSKPPPPAEAYGPPSPSGTFTPEMYDQAMDAFERGAQEGLREYRERPSGKRSNEEKLKALVVNNATLPLRAGATAVEYAAGKAGEARDAWKTSETGQAYDRMLQADKDRWARADEAAKRRLEQRPEEKADVDLLLTAKRVPRTSLVERAASAPTVIDMSGDVVKENGKPMAPKGKSAKQKLLDAGVDPAYVNDPGFSEETAAQVALEMGLR